jgi:hypothetical protein
MGSILLHAEFFVYFILALAEPEERDDEDDQAALRGHIKAEGEAKNADAVE